MSNISPFKGTRYNTEKVKDISKVTAPPYDVISSQEQKDLYESNPYNIVRILLGMDFPEDNQNENKYMRAKAFLKDWHDKGILKTDEKESIYIYEQDFKVDGRIKTRLGFMALLKLEDFDRESSTVYPHENTLTAPKEDRTKLIHSIKANIGPIFAIYEDEDKALLNILKQECEKKALIDIVDANGIRNKLWVMDDSEKVAAVKAIMKDKKIFIADGHHRYEVGLAFSKFIKDPRYGYILSYFTDLNGEGLVIFPVHRLLGNIPADILKNIEGYLKDCFKIEKLNSQKDVLLFLKKSADNQPRFVMYIKGKFIGLIWAGKDDLDVNIVKNMIIEPLKTKCLEPEKISIDFTKDLDYAVRKVNQGEFSLAVLLNPVNIKQIRDIAFAGKRMPQKSTYFYPKVLSGLVINEFKDGNV